MTLLDVGMLPVCKRDQVVGTLTDRDITIRATARGEDPSSIHVQDVMTSEVIECSEDCLVSEAARMMQDHQIRRLIVLDRGHHLVGIVSLGDLAVATGDEELTGVTLEAISHSMPLP
jgi:CBS domain-containing protein